MLDQIKQTLTTDRLRDRGQDARDRLKRARSDFRLARSHGKVRLWSLGTETLSRAHEALERAPDGLDPVVDPLRKALDEQLDRLTSTGIEDYDSLNARNAAAAMRGLDLVRLERVDRHERAHKNRKTVLGAIEAERKRIAKAT